MKKIIFPILVLLLITGSSCQKEIEFTEEQKATIEKEVRDQFDKLFASISQLNIDTWSEFHSKDEFVSHLSGRRGVTYGFSAWRDSVAISFSARERHRSEPLEVRVTALTPDLALLTSVAIWENWWKDGLYRKTNGKSTYIWKKEQDGWKIIHAHESGIDIEIEETQTEE